MKIDELCTKINKTMCPVCVGLDTSYEYLNEDYKSAGTSSNEEIAKCIYRFNCDIIDSCKDVVPSVKVQVAYYEQYGYHGVKCFYDTMQYAAEAGLIVIADVKRNDIGSTAKAYSKAFLLGSAADFITVNAYLGIDGIAPFIEDCEKTGKGMFVLVKTSNPSGGEFQDLEFGGKKLYSIVGEKTAQWGRELTGLFGYSSIGAVVGATYPQQALELRESLKSAFFLVPGYGAQGAGADDIAVNFDKDGLGAVVNSSRGILLAYRKDGYSNEPAVAARQAAVEMKEDIYAALMRRR